MSEGKRLYYVFHPHYYYTIKTLESAMKPKFIRVLIIILFCYGGRHTTTRTTHEVRQFTACDDEHPFSGFKQSKIWANPRSIFFCIYLQFQKQRYYIGPTVDETARLKYRVSSFTKATKGFYIDWYLRSFIYCIYFCSYSCRSIFLIQNPRRWIEWNMPLLRYFSLSLINVV